MNAKRTALDAYFVRSAAIHAKLERLQQLAEEHFGHDPDSIHRSHLDDFGRVEAWLDELLVSSTATVRDDARQPSEVIVINQTRLTETQTAILTAAASSAYSDIEPSPGNLRGGARTKIVEDLLARGLVVDVGGYGLLTSAGYAAVGNRCPVSKGVQNLDAPNALTKRYATHTVQNMEPTRLTILPGTKLATIIDAMRRPGGVTMAHMMACTGWQLHTVPRCDLRHDQGAPRWRGGHPKGHGRAAGLSRHLTKNRPGVCA